ncbi:MAG: YtxH domain-containing protein [Desulfuromonadales bacterium]|nr:YtxH domain-containing protein [Desulfuromonadales bacterium]MDT8422815.1 YtxH domain-containing protein [Desulfuromonadales bacterium]
MSDHNHGGASLLAFLAGAAVGGVAALLLAPRSGAETRQKVLDAAEELKVRSQTLVTEAENRVREVVEEGKEALDQNKEVFLSAVAAGKEAFEKAKPTAGKKS